MDMIELAERVERGSGSDRELDADICIAIGWIGTVRDNSTFEGPPRNVRRADYPSYEDEPHDELDYESRDGESWTSDTPALTASLDASVALLERVLPGWWWALNQEGEDVFVVHVWKLMVDARGEATSPARALLGAILRALAAKDETP